eukprot:scaffold662_cov364-Pavlova_lutheri.AAC.34
MDGGGAMKVGESVRETTNGPKTILSLGDLNAPLSPQANDGNLLDGVKQITSSLENAKDAASDSLSGLATMVSESTANTPALSKSKALLEQSPAFADFEAFSYAISNAIPDELKNSMEALAQNPTNLAFAASTLLGLPLVAFWLIRFYGYGGDLTPKKALGTLNTGNAVLVDIRSDAERAEGIPDLRWTARGRGVAFPVLSMQGKERSMIASPNELALQATAVAIAGLRQTSGGGPIILMDRSGNGDAVSVAKLLAQQGLTNVFAVKGGFKSWKATGLDVKQGVSSYQEGTIKLVAEKAGEITEDISKGFESKSREVLTTPVLALYTLGVLGVALLVATGTYKKVLETVGVFGISTTVFLRVISYRDASEAAKDVDKLLRSVGIRLPEIKRKLRKALVSSGDTGKVATTVESFVGDTGSLDKNVVSEPLPPATSNVEPAETTPDTSPGDDGLPDVAEGSKAVAAADPEDSSGRKAEVRSWIENWRALQSPASVNGSVDVESRVAEARAWIANWRAENTPAAMEEPNNEVSKSKEEVRSWIENWRALQSSAPVKGGVDEESRVAEARAWIANWRAGNTPAAMEEPEKEVSNSKEEVRSWIDNWRLQQEK